MTAATVPIPGPVDRRRRQRRAAFTWVALSVYVATVVYVLIRPSLSKGEMLALDAARLALMGLGVFWCYRAATRLKQPQWRFLGVVAAAWTITMVDGVIDDLGDGRTAGFPSTAQYAYLVIGPLLIMALLMVGPAHGALGGPPAGAGRGLHGVAGRPLPVLDPDRQHPAPQRRA